MAKASRQRSILYGGVVGCMVLIGGLAFYRASERTRQAELHAASWTAATEAISSLELEIADSFSAALRLREAADRQTPRRPEGAGRFRWRLGAWSGNFATEASAHLSQAAADAVVRLVRDNNLDSRPNVSGPYRANDGTLLALVRVPVFESGTWKWFVAGMPLEDLLGGSGLRSLSVDGYDYVLKAIDPVSGELRVITRSSEDELQHPVENFIPHSRRQWILQVSPRSRLITVHKWTSALLVCLFMLIAGLITYDTSENRTRLLAGIALKSARLKQVGRRLMDEVESRSAIEKQFRHAGYHDSLTDLPNRRYFITRLERALVRQRRQPGAFCAVLLVNLDRFKSVNDSFGFSAGDDAILEVVKRITNCFRPSDLTVARMGGDEFAILLFSLTDPAVPAAAAMRIQEALAKPINVQDHTLYLTACVGVATSISGYESAEEIMRAADIALSQAKKEGRGKYAIFDRESRDQVVALKQLETGLHLALQRQEFRLLFQPIVDLRNGSIAGMETLIRWNHPLEGLIPPSKFITIAEESGLIVPITRWILTEAFRQAEHWRDTIPEDIPFYLTVNLSGEDLRQPDLCNFVGALQRRYPLPSGTIRLEVTESMMISNVAAASELVAGLRSLEVPLLLDDFGTGYSSLSYLNRFRFDYLKVDRSFVAASQSGQNEVILKTILQLARNLKIKTVVEGVENAAVLSRMREFDCDFGQGYYFAKPLPPENAEKLLRARTRW